MKYSIPVIALFSLSIISCDSQQKASNQALKQTNNSTKTQESGKEEDIETKVNGLIEQLTLAEKISLVHANSKFTIAGVPRLGIKEMSMSDGPHGVRQEINRHDWAPAGWTDDHATYLPHLTSVAASWDREMANLHGQVLGAEARDRKKDLILGPGVNLARLPLYGRNFEYMGEDPVLAAKLVVPQIKAIQQHDVGATVKHYALNTQELNRTGVNAKPDERTLREVYLPAFEAAVKEADVYAMMGSYNQYFGTNANQSKHLVMDILKGEWGYQGVLLTDWNVDITTYEAAVHGLDIEMGTDVPSYDDYFLAKPFQESIESGKISEAVLDDKVRRILRIQFRMGMMSDNRKVGARNTKTHQANAKTIAENGVVLLKNNDVLPINTKKIKNILVLGPNADKVHGNGGGSSEVKSLYEVSPLQGLKNKLGEHVNITALRARSSELSAIASDYVASRHWTGTPAWNIAYYEDENFTELVEESWIVDASYIPKKEQTSTNIKMTAQIKPFSDGQHILKVKTQGQFKLTIDEKVVFSVDSPTAKIHEIPVNFNAQQQYKFVISYSGNSAFTLGWDAPGNLFSDEKTYLAAAKNADLVIYFGGLSHGDDRESIDRPNMKLPQQQDEIISKLLAANENTVVFLVAGSAVEMPWAEKANAIVWGWYGGMEAGNAFADILTGDVNPSGKLPITLAKKLEDNAAIALNDYNAKESLYSEGVFIGYRWFEQQNIEVNFPFGHGLSYTDFSYANLRLNKADFVGDESIIVEVDVTNVGKVAGAEVVQLYLHDQKASVERPYKELKGFDKVKLAPNETKTVSIILSKRDLSFWDVNTNNWLAENGKFTVLVGASSSDIKLEQAFSYKN